MASTVQFAEDLARGRWDIEFFVLRFLGIALHPGQVRFLRAMLARDATMWRAAYLTIFLSAGNRAGKTLALAVAIIHACVYKLCVRPPQGGDRDLDRWMKADYTWFHFAIQQEVADLVFFEITKILGGVHEAQKDRGCPLTLDMPNAASWDRKYNGEYRWIVFHALLGGAQIHFRTTGERALGSLGRDMHGISYDECAFDPKLDFVFGEVMNLRRLGTGGQILFASTPTEGLTMFSDLWETGNPEAPDRYPNRMAIRMSTRDNIGYGLDQSMFDRLVADMDETLVLQNIDGHFIEGRSSYFIAASVDGAFDPDLPETQEAKHRHRYVQGVDAGLTDPAWAIVLDVTNARDVIGVKAERARHRPSTGELVAMTANNHYAYTVNRSDLRSSCSTAIDATGFGGKMFRESLGGITPLRNVEFGGSRQKKLKLLGDLKTAIDEHRLRMPRSGLWLQLRRQLAGYKLDDRGIEQDAVMALACAWAEARRDPGEASAPVSFNPYAAVEEIPVRIGPWARRTA